jgi:TRAP-type C4-dicarboxylate transport system permease small subunit
MDESTEVSWWWYLAQNVEEAVGTVFFLVMVISVSIGVLFRYVFSHPLIWTEEIANFAFLWAIFMGAAAAAKRHQHIVVDTLMLLTPKLFQRIVGILTGGMIAAMLATVTIVGLQYAYSQRNTTTEAIEMRVFWWALAAPTFSTFAFWHTLQDIAKLVRGEPVGAERDAVTAHEAATGQGGTL